MMKLSKLIIQQLISWQRVFCTANSLCASYASKKGNTSNLWSYLKHYHLLIHTKLRSSTVQVQIVLVQPITSAFTQSQLFNCQGKRWPNAIIYCIAKDGLPLQLVKKKDSRYIKDCYFSHLGYYQKKGRHTTK